MRKFSKFFIVLVIATTTLVLSNCTKDDTTTTPTPTPTPKTKKELLVDKIWYAKEGTTMPQSLRVNTDGTVQFYNPNFSGTYSWGPNDSLYLTFTGYPPMTYWIKTVTDSTMEEWPTFEPISNIYKFTSKKP
jgi:hypothetical protein